MTKNTTCSVCIQDLKPRSQVAVRRLLSESRVSSDAMQSCARGLAISKQTPYRRAITNVWIRSQCLHSKQSSTFRRFYSQVHPQRGAYSSVQPEDIRAFRDILSNKNSLLTSMQGRAFFNTHQKPIKVTRMRDRCSNCPSK